MSLLTIAQLMVAETKAAIYQTGLNAATALGLPVTSWSAGDPTRSYYHYLAEILSALEGIVVTFIGAGFLDLAEQQAIDSGDSTWLKILAKQVFNVDAIEATYAETSVTLSNAGGGYYPDLEAGDLTFKNTTTGKTYHSTSGGTLASGPGTTLPLDVIADEAGADSSAGATEIDDMVTTLLGVTVSNATAAVGLDEESPQSIAERCRAKLGMLSANGPRDAYNFVAKSPELTGTTGVTRSRSFGDSATGIVRLYLAGPSGTVSGADRDAVEEAVLEWAAPLCITPSVVAASAVVVPVTYELWLYSSVGQTGAEVEDAVETALGTLFSTRPIGGDVIPPAAGKLYTSLILSTIRGVFPAHTFRASLTLPAADVALVLSASAGEVATLGTVTGTVNFLEDP